MAQFPMITAPGNKLTQHLELVIFGTLIVGIAYTLQGCVPNPQLMEKMTTFDDLGEGWCGCNNKVFTVCREFNKDSKEKCENECNARPECGAYTYSDQARPVPMV